MKSKTEIQTKSKATEILKYAFKLGLGAVLIYYVLHSKMVDFTLVKSALANPVNLVVSLFFLALSVFCCAARWHLLVKKQELNLSFKDLLELTMIGNFFNTFMPGSVGGDLIKAWYVAGQEPKRKTKAIFTVLLDRAIGLSVIVFYAALTLVFFTGWLKGHHELKVVALSIWGFTTASVLFAVLFFLPQTWDWAVSHKLLALLRRSAKMEKVVEAALLYRRYLGTISLAVVLSAISILGTNLLYSIQGKALGIETDLAHYFFVVPVALTVSAIPVLPGGLGVGQIAFYSLFKWTGHPNPEQGATLATLLQVYTILFNCFGAIFYLKFKRSPKETSNEKGLPTSHAFNGQA